jgi:hypothetical protein
VWNEKAFGGQIKTGFTKARWRAVKRLIPEGVRSQRAGDLERRQHCRRDARP